MAIKCRVGNFNSNGKDLRDIDASECVDLASVAANRSSFRVVENEVSKVCGKKVDLIRVAGRSCVEVIRNALWWTLADAFLRDSKNLLRGRACTVSHHRAQKPRTMI